MFPRVAFCIHDIGVVVLKGLRLDELDVQIEQ